MITPLLEFNKNNNCDEKKAVIYSIDICPAHLCFNLQNITRIFESLDSDETDYKTFFNLLWNTYLNNETYCYLERQYPPNFAHSGIRVDLDPIQKTDRRLYDAVFIVSIVKMLCKLIFKYVDIEAGTETRIFVLENSKPSKVSDLYKDGLHIMVPGIKIRQTLKMQILKEYAAQVQQAFVSQGYENRSVYDAHSEDVPVQIYGSVRKGKTESKTVLSYYKVIFADKIRVNNCDMQELLYKKKHNKINSYSKCNLALELSIHYPGALFKKINYEMRQNVVTNVLINTCFNETSNIDILIKRVNILCNSNYKAKEVYDYVSILNPERGMTGKFKEWSEIVKTIMRIDLRFKPIAKLFSIKTDEKSWNNGGNELIEKYASEIDDKLKYEPDPANFCQKSLNFLRSLAKKDNPAEYTGLSKKLLEAQIMGLISSGRCVTQDDVARLVHMVAGERLKCISRQSGMLKNEGTWLEYITPDRSVMPRNIKPFLYKWYSHNVFPDEVDHIISKEIMGLLRKTESYFIEQQSLCESKEEQQKYKAILKSLATVITMCGTHTKIEDIKRRCCISWFRDVHLLGNLDKDANVFGVKNGVLVFGKKAEFLESTNMYNITRTTDARYVAYDENHKYIHKINRILSEIIPDAKKRAGILMHISLCFIREHCGRYFNIFYSAGSSGKSVLMNLIQNAFGVVNNSEYGPNFGYYDTIDANVFINDKQDVNGVDHHLTKLEHPRFVHCPEGKNGLIQPHIFKKLRDGISVRGIFQSTRNIVFPGIIAYVTNEKPRFLNYNYALARRFLFYRFTETFTPNPRKENEHEHLKNDEVYKKSLNNKKWGEAFLSILVHHYNLAAALTDPEQIYKESGLDIETQEYLDAQNYMSQFISSYVKMQEDSKIAVIDFCTTYAIWYKKKLNLRQDFSAEKFTTEAKEMLEKYLICENKTEYFSGICLEDTF